MPHDAEFRAASTSPPGVTFVREPHEVPWGIEAVFRDDSGNLWGLVQPR